MTTVVVIGAGPYGLSLAAHLDAAGVDFKIFGKPMANWRQKMPAGMLLKSEGFASNLPDPRRSLSLRRFCELRSIPYRDLGLPVSLDTFVSYGLQFQQMFVPGLDDADVSSVERLPAGGFLVQPARGEAVEAERVVVATGISHYEYVPPELATLPSEHLSHSSECGDLKRFASRDVVVVGAGASALDTAALLHEAGARVQLVARRATVAFNPRPDPGRSLVSRIRYPDTRLGPGWKNVVCTEMPLGFYFLPQKVRLDVVRRHLGPAPGWFIRDRTEGRFPFILGAARLEPSVAAGRVHLDIGMSDGARRSIECDHIISATGYKVDVRRLPFLGEELVRDLQTVNHAPRLSLSFESSVRGLYFTGLAAANHFGPAMRFATGAEFAAPRLARHLAAQPGARKARGVALQG